MTIAAAYIGVTRYARIGIVTIAAAYIGVTRFARIGIVTIAAAYIGVTRFARVASPWFVTLLLRRLVAHARGVAPVGGLRPPAPPPPEPPSPCARALRSLRSRPRLLLAARGRRRAPPFNPPASWARCRSPSPQFGSACIGRVVTGSACIADSQGYAGAPWLGLWPALYLRPLRSALLAENIGYLFGFPSDCTRIPPGLYFEATTLPGVGGAPRQQRAPAPFGRPPGGALARKLPLEAASAHASRSSRLARLSARGPRCPAHSHRAGPQLPALHAPLPTVAPALRSGFGDSGCRGLRPLRFFRLRAASPRQRAHVPPTASLRAGRRRLAQPPSPGSHLVARRRGSWGRGRGLAVGRKRAGRSVVAPPLACARRPAPRHFLPPLAPARRRPARTRPLRVRCAPFPWAGLLRTANKICRGVSKKNRYTTGCPGHPFFFRHSRPTDFVGLRQPHGVRLALISRFAFVGLFVFDGLPIKIIPR